MRKESSSGKSGKVPEPLGSCGWQAHWREPASKSRRGFPSVSGPDFKESVEGGSGIGGAPLRSPVQTGARADGPRLIAIRGNDISLGINGAALPRTSTGAR
jgi:hypothetical protein